MSKFILSAAIRGAHKIVDKCAAKLDEAVQKYGENQEISYPNTAYYLPIIYSLMGIEIKTLKDALPVMKRCKELLPPVPAEKFYMPYLGPGLDAGLATLFAEEIYEAIRILEQPDFYYFGEDLIEKGAEKIWAGPADDVIMRKRGIEFVDGSAPGFAAIVGAAPSVQEAVDLVHEYQTKNLYIFLAARDIEGKTSVAEQLLEGGVQIGWPTRIVPFGPEISAAVFALGFACRAALSFGGLKKGQALRNLLYNKDRIFAFINAVSEIPDEWYANAAGAINWGFPTITNQDIPEILPTGICTYEHVVSNVPMKELASKSIEVRGLKVTITEVPVPVSYGPAFEGERVRKGDLYLECGGGKTQAVELVTSKRMDEVEDGKIEVIGPDVKDIKEGSRLPMAVVVEVAGRAMQPDFEPILERQIHHLVNYAQGVMHIGQRDIAWYRFGKAAIEKGFELKHIGALLHAKYHQDFGAIFDKCQVKIYTEEDKVKEITEQARKIYAERDARIEGMTDETTEIYYSCTLCQSFAPSHVCVISPERTGLCGAYNWMDCKASYEINPTGPNQPIEKGETLDEKYGQWKGVNDFVYKASRQAVERYNFYSIVHEPMTTCGCCECIAAVLPMCNGIMTVNRDYTGETPCGMKFTTLAGVIGGGQVTPGFVGHSKYNICQRKFILGDGGLLRMVWMPTSLKEEIGERLRKRGEELGYPNLIDMIADETVGVTEDEIYPYLEEKGHPALKMESILA
ncbi:MAG: CO dehydrogenase/CO-methylating acetyl-CoA synthase complex subunit beta [Deltaproteobacteria bacterium]|nr:CO dehydrogenase/CO-methylating acetyl-CoA synthase complex subunit beta [Deltaproteobacteria bacterium]MBW1952873.1 CO dehydrogenase/CO-methylating acetyl-CoA synthase complex subunit beta [Deltaproteobacteria bacterium]MBW1985871.1 CO dehydrogenase/CO-methylating acetyl-CoA synthase complex subunit beta [Deltaproteobacteria bacterium]MBW2133631.1 CO dehydrogenase/CO-methylating acetyl-CoA synthase complex subunit beta [Deltaproteobacteria bacterium]